MSILEAPRVYFKGEVTWDPIVTNNTSSFYNEAAAETVFPAAADKVAAFRREAIDAVVGGGNWNPHGTHRAVFYDTAVCGVDLGRNHEQQDPFLAAAVSFTGMLVDLEPYGSISSQLFFDEMRFGAGGGYLISAPRTSRVTARYINFARNSANKMIAGVASVVWQSSFAKTDGLRIDAFDSPVLAALHGALADDDVLGLTVRFNAYRTIYFDDPTLRNGAPSVKRATQTLQAKLNGGGFQPNPARSLIVGAIGLWRRNEPAHESGERVLIPPASSSLGGSAFGRLNGNTLVLDLANVFPEIDDALTKQNFGTLSVVAVDPATNAETVLATFPYSAYDRAAYEASAGIVTAAVGAAACAAAQGTLELRGGDGSVLLAEKALRAVPDTPNLYLDQGTTANATARVYDRGIPVSKAIPVTLYSMTPGGDKIRAATQLQTDANGVVSFAIAAETGEIQPYVFAADPTDSPPDQGVDTQANTYMNVRILPADAWVGQVAPTWDNVFGNVLANWNAMAPCMDNWLNLADPAQVKAFGASLKAHTDPAKFENYAYMPVTRDMTAGQRALLYAFLDAPPPPAAAAVEFMGAAPEPQRRNYAELSRELRGGAE